jgi:PAS domain S-box-containing protein
MLPPAFKALDDPLVLTLVKLPTLVLGVTVLVWVLRRWVPTELAERNARRQQELELRARLEQSLKDVKESEERFRLAAGGSRDAVWDWDLQTNALFSSPRFAEMLGYTPGTLVIDGHSLQKVFHPDDLGPTTQAIKAACAGETPTYDLRHRMLRADKSVLHVHSTATVIRDQAGVALRLVGFSRDVTDEVNAQAMRVQSEKLESLGLLAGGIAHDFNNLLAVLSASLTLAERQLQTGRPVHETLATAALAIDRGAVLTRQLLAFAGKEQRTQHRLDLNRLVEANVALLSVSLSPSVKLEARLAPELPAILADDAQLQQVVMNLITNAAEAIGPAGGTVTVQTSLGAPGALSTALLGQLPRGPTVILRVCDTGAGMSPEVKARIFDPFFSTKGSGRGLGLAALSGILRAHGAAVDLVTAPGEGTTFTLCFPALAAPAAKPDAPARAKAPTPLPVAPGALSITVLVVDDEALLRRSASRLLRHLGCGVAEANDGQEALARVRASPAGFDLVLMDVTMPVMDGFEAARQIQLLAPGLPIILSSGYAQDFEARLPPGVLTLPKPYNGEQLERLVRAALRTAPAA